MFARLEPWHIVVLVIVFIALFGYKKLPDAARSVGRSLRILKAETKGLRGDDDAPTPTAKAPADVSADSTAKQSSTDEA